MSEKFNYLKGNSDSNFPNSIDGLLYLQDKKISTQSVRDSYGTNLQNHPILAGDMLETNESFTPMSACLMNNIQKRTYALQDYLINTLPERLGVSVSTENPTTYADGHMWIKLEE